MSRAAAAPSLRSRIRGSSRPARDDPLALAYWERENADPELAKALGLIQSYLGEANALLQVPAERAPLRPANATEHLRALLTRDVDRLTADAAWELVNALKRELLVLGDEEYVRAMLDYEVARDVQPERWHGWSEHFGTESLQALRERWDEAPSAEARRPLLVEAVRHLRHLYLARAEAGLERRVRAAQKCHYLSLLALLLIAFFVALTITLERIGGPGIWEAILLAASAGALGATLSGVFRVRDKLVGLDDLRSFWPAMRVQPLVGAVGGLVVLLVIESGALSIGSGDTGTPAAQALLAFAAGFSEPFFLGIVEKVAVLPDKRPAAQH